MQGISDRVEDALLLWKNGRRSGAFLCALIAVAATARKRYPKLKDRECFEQFLTDCHHARIHVEYRGECQAVEYIFYKWLRCQLVHEAELPSDIQFMDEQHKGTMSVRAGGAPEYILKIGIGWFDYMIHCVINAPENGNVPSI